MSNSSSVALRLLAVVALLGVTAEAVIRELLLPAAETSPAVCRDCDPLARRLVEVTQPELQQREAVPVDGADVGPGPKSGVTQGKADDLDGVQGRTGTLEGIVRFRGEPPESSVADQAGRKSALLAVDRETQGLAWAVVSLKTRRTRTRPEPRKGESGRPPAPAVTIDQREQSFVPRVVAVESGAGVRFTNSDVANHNVHAHGLDSRNQFNVFTGSEGRHIHRFRLEEMDRPIRIGCDIHPWMRAWVYVFNHPVFAVTDARGKFVIDPFPAGEHTVLIRQADGGLEREVDIVVTTGESTRLEIDFDAHDLREIDP